MPWQALVGLTSGQTQPHNNLPLIWHARLYAKKIGVELADFEFNVVRRHTTTPSYPQQKIPAFLLKSTTKPATEAKGYGIG